jgi:ADP-ribosylation factor family
MHFLGVSYCYFFKSIVYKNISFTVWDVGGQTKIRSGLNTQIDITFYLDNFFNGDSKNFQMIMLLFFKSIFPRNLVR